MASENKNWSDPPSEQDRAAQPPDDRVNPPKERIAPVEPAQYVQPVTTQPVNPVGRGCAWWLWILILIVIILIIWGGWWRGYWWGGPVTRVAPNDPNVTPHAHVMPSPYPNSAAPVEPAQPMEPGAKSQPASPNSNGP